MQERRANKIVLTVIGVMLSCAMFPAPAYAADAENWASLEGWLSAINGKIQLCYGELQTIAENVGSTATNYWTSTRVTGVYNALTSTTLTTSIPYRLNLIRTAVESANNGVGLLIEDVGSIYWDMGTIISLLDNNNQGSLGIRQMLDYADARLWDIESYLDSNLPFLQDLYYESQAIDLNTSYLIEDLDDLKTFTSNTDSNISYLKDFFIDWEDAGFRVDTGLSVPNLAPIQSSLNTISTDVSNIYTRVNATGISVSGLLTAFNSWKSAGYTVDTGLTIPSLSGIQNSLNTISSSLNDVYSRIGTGNTTLSSLLTAWNAWKNDGYFVNTGLTLPSLLEIETSLTDIKSALYGSNNVTAIFRMQQLVGFWNNWINSGYKVDTGLVIPSISSLESAVVSINGLLSAWVQSGYVVETGLTIPSNPAFDDSRVLLGISSLGESVDAIYHWLILSNTVDEVIGDFDFGEVAENANLLMENASQLAPFVGFELMAVMLQIWAATGVHNPNLDMQFNFMPGSNELVTIDLSWLADAQPLFNMLCISMLLLCLVNSSVRIIEQEATG